MAGFPALPARGATGWHHEPMARPHLSIPHPWHGLPVGPEPPEIVHAFIEITPFDGIKYEVDKVSMADYDEAYPEDG